MIEEQSELVFNYFRAHSVYYYFRKWERDGTLEEVHDTLASDIRKAKGRKITPSVGIMDSQSTKRSILGQENRGHDLASIQLSMVRVMLDKSK